MLTKEDRSKLIQASQVSSVLVQNLRNLASADNPLLGEMAMEILQVAVQVELKLKRLETLTK